MAHQDDCKAYLLRQVKTGKWLCDWIEGWTPADHLGRASIAYDIDGMITKKIPRLSARFGKIEMVPLEGELEEQYEEACEELINK